MEVYDSQLEKGKDDTSWRQATSVGYLPADIYEQMAADQERAAHDDLEHMAAAPRAHGVRVHIHIERGDVAAALIDMAESLHAGLVVMTTHGRTGLTRFALGSIADRLVRGGTAPVLLIRSSADLSSAVDLVRAIVPLDGSTLAEKALDLAASLADVTLHDITLLRAVDRRDGSSALEEAEHYMNATRDRLASRLAGHNCLVSSLVLTGSPADCIVKSAEENGQLIIMSSHGEAGIGRWTVGSVTDRVLCDAKAPLLLVHSTR